MHRLIRILTIGGGLAVLLFIATLIAFGGAHTVPISDQISRSASLIPPSISDINLTDAITDEVAKGIVENNPAGPFANGSSNVAMPTPDEVVAQLLADQLQDFDVDSIWPVLSEDQLTIIPETTPQNRRVYFQSYLDIVGRRLLTPYLHSTPPVPAELLAVSHAYKDTMAELAALAVPHELVEIHLDTLDLLGAQANIFEMLSNYKQDPVKAYLASQLHEDITQGASELKEKMLSYIKEHPVDF